MSEDYSEASERARARIFKQNQERAALERARRGSPPIQSRAGTPKQPEPPVPPPEPITDAEFDICHVNVVMRRKVKNGYDYHRVSVQVGCGTHLSGVKMDYEPLGAGAVRDLPTRADVFGRDVARFVAAELNRRRG
jgi:hypothetical protein